MKLLFVLPLLLSVGVQCLSLGKPTRRDFLNSAVAGAVGAGSSLQPSWAADSLPFCVIGANGKTGTKAVHECLARGFPVKATSRSGVYNDAVDSSLLMPTVCDVTNMDTVKAAVEGTRAVIFAASASKQGGTAAQVDNEGLVNVAKACLDANVPHLVIVSSGGVSKPDSPVFKFLNLFGGIMDQKIMGEDSIRALYKDSKLAYTVIRPGGLTTDPARGVAEIELNQGDEKSGRISRIDVARLCVEATLYPESTSHTTFECYDADTGKPLATVGASNIMKQKTDPAEFATGKERRGQSYKEIFQRLQKDV
jgi:uncharacterized protein YbjT (DUF2867 family)